MSVLIAYASIEGQTRKIANFLENLAANRGATVHLHNTLEPTATVDFGDVDTVILAAPVHERRHPMRFEAFVTSKRNALNSRKTLMISVSMSAAFPEGQEDAQDYLDEMKMRTALDTDADILVAGAIRSRNYGYYETQVLEHVVLRGRGFDPSLQEHEFTVWDALKAGVRAFLDGPS